MSDFFATVGKILIALLVLDVLVIVHELGHYISARIFKVSIKEFAIGMGPVIFKRQGKHNLFSLRAFPIGGFLAMEGEDEESDNPDAFNKKQVWKRIIIIISGSVMNLLLGFLLALGLTATTELLPSTTVARFLDFATSNHEGGLMEGDEILKMDGKRISIYYDISNHLTLNETGTVDFTVRRDGEIVELENVQLPTDKQGNVTFTTYDFSVYAEDKNVGVVLKHGFYRTVSMGKLVYTTLIDMVRGKYGVEDMSGPVGTVNAIGEAASQSLYTLVYLAAFIAVNLGLFNLLPLPALDGGRLLFLLIELVRGKPIPMKYESIVHLVGFALLIVLIVVITFSDIRNLIVGGKEARAAAEVFLRCRL